MTQKRNHNGYQADSEVKQAGPLKKPKLDSAESQKCPRMAEDKMDFETNRVNFASKKPNIRDTLYVLYQSLEYPNNFRKALTEKLNGALDKKNVGQILECAPSVTGKEEHTYHLLVNALIETYVSYLDNKPDIIIFGEYKPIHGYCLTTQGYNLVEDITPYNYKNDGRRNLTVYVNDRMKQRPVSIAYKLVKHNNFISSGEPYHSSVNELIQMFESANMNDIKKQDIERQKKFHKVQMVLGDCVEIKVADRSILIAHVPNEDSVNKVKSVLKEHSDIITDVAGDMNFRLHKAEHLKIKKLENHLMLANTDCSKVHSKIDNEYAQLQNNTNLKGHSSSGTKPTANNGGYFATYGDAVSKMQVVGSFWAITDKSKHNRDLSDKVQDSYYVMSDHKGFLLELKII